MNWTCEMITPRKKAEDAIRSGGAQGMRFEVKGTDLRICEVTGLGVHATSYADAVARITAWARTDQGRYVCAANVHMAMEAHDDPEFRQLVEAASLVTPDGMPLVWMMRRLGHPHQSRVYGPTLMVETLAAAEKQGLKVGFYGGSPEELELMAAKLGREYPALKVGYRYSPPFRPLSAEEERDVIDDIGRSGLDILFVGLGCPKQERWMARHRHQLPMVALGVGAGFAFYAGTVRQAPNIIQRAGLEWAFRLLAEPRRLWRRYLRHNPRFVVLAARQLWQQRS
ncbi:MAG: WecB/TagA/CpsF family glycosyltransferase [Actinobacteria bacterium]|nr:WecB/TagA/CpsF family glycosyltransferase [Actinomycetota bacterium]